MMREYEYTGKAMGTEFSIAIISDSEELANSLATKAEAKIHAYEKQFSRFLPESELSQLNTQKDAIVSENFLAVVQEAYSLYQETEGIFNPLVQIERLGYTTSFDTLDSPQKFESEEPYTIDFSKTLIEPTSRRIVLQEGQKLDFGGFLKGYLAQILSIEIERSSPLVTGAIVNIGGDIHARGLDAQSAQFVFQIYNPLTKESNLAVPLFNASLATSGTYKRTWENDGAKTHHILDATGTQNPDTDIVSASVIHPKGSTAEAYAKVFLSLGEKKAMRILQNKDLAYVLIKNNGEIITHLS
ncbi:MAG: FAD:protein FMN transferase [Minisyncoccia bacterium]